MTAADLRAQRKQIGWTQAELARRLRYSKSYVSQVEGGDRPLTPAFERKVNETFTDFRRTLERQ